MQAVLQGWRTTKGKHKGKGFSSVQGRFYVTKVAKLRND